MDQDRLVSLYRFFQQAEKLKLVMRHSWIGDENRQESTAEHSWVLCLIAVSIFPYLQVTVNQERVLRLLIIHDLVEAIAGDIPYFEEGARRDGKQAAERAALSEMTKDLEAGLRQELSETWEEFEAQKSPESRVARAIDKYEALLTHAQANMATWSDGDYKIAFAKDDELFAFDPFISQLKQHIDAVTYAKIKEAGTASRLDPDYLHRYFPA